MIPTRDWQESLRNMTPSVDIQKAAEDLRFLLTRRYPRKAALELVGNRYSLTADQRHLLHRGVFADVDARLRCSKRISIRNLRQKKLAIDGYNVLITVEAALSGRPLVLADDGFVRDISGLSGNFRKSRKTGEALQGLFDALKKWRPQHTLFLFDAPISKSGRLAQEVRERLKEAGLAGDAMAVPVPERILLGFQGVVATSDTAIIDRSQEVLDLAGYLVKRIKPFSLVRLGKRNPLGGA